MKKRFQRNNELWLTTLIMFLVHCKPLEINVPASVKENPIQNYKFYKQLQMKVKDDNNSKMRNLEGSQR